jgi:hypothetical protein
MKTIPETIQNCNHWLHERAFQTLIPSISTGLENWQNSLAFSYAKTLDSKPFFNCLRTAETIRNALRTELRQIHSNSLSLRGGLQPDEVYAKGISPALRLILLAKRLLRRCAPRNDVFKTWLKPLIGEIGRAKNLRFISPQPPEACLDQLPGPEAIADRPSLWAGSASTATDDDRPEVVQ